MQQRHGLLPCSHVEDLEPYCSIPWSATRKQGLRNKQTKQTKKKKEEETWKKKKRKQDWWSFFSTIVSALPALILEPKHSHGPGLGSIQTISPVTPPAFTDGWCYGFIVCVPTKSIPWNPTPQCDGIGGWDLGEIIRNRWCLEGGTVMMGLVPF